MGFEKFGEAGRGRGRPQETAPKISLRKSGSIGINNAALEEYFAESGGAVMYFDEDANRVGIEPVADKDADEAAYTITKNESGGTVAPQAFLETYNLVPDVTTQYRPTWNEDAGLLVIDLDDPLKKYGSADEDDK